MVPAVQNHRIILLIRLAVSAVRYSTRCCSLRSEWQNSLQLSGDGEVFSDWD